MSESEVGGRLEKESVPVDDLKVEGSAPRKAGKKKRSIWSDPALLTAAAALLAAILPLTAALEGVFNLALESKKHRQTMEIMYLDRALDPSKGARYQHGVLTYLSTIFEDNEAMANWVSGQLRTVREVLYIRANISQAEEVVATLENELLEEKRSAEIVEEDLRVQLVEAKANLASLRAKLESAQSALEEGSLEARRLSPDLVLSDRYLDLVIEVTEEAGASFYGLKMTLAVSAELLRVCDAIEVKVKARSGSWRETTSWSITLPTTEEVLDESYLPAEYQYGELVISPFCLLDGESLGIEESRFDIYRRSFEQNSRSKRLGL